MDEQQAMIPYYAHEGEMSRMERVNKRWFVAFLIVLVMLFATNAGWIIYEHQFETYEIQQTVETGQGDAAVAGIGDASNGQSNSTHQGQGAEEQQ